MANSYQYSEKMMVGMPLQKGFHTRSKVSDSSSFSFHPFGKELVLDIFPRRYQELRAQKKGRKHISLYRIMRYRTKVNEYVIFMLMRQTLPIPLSIVNLSFSERLKVLAIHGK